MKPKKNTVLYPKEWGELRAEELLNLTNDKGLYLPPSITVEDLEMAVFQEFKLRGLQVNLKEKGILPVIYVENMEWAEFNKNWKIGDINYSPKMPFLTFRRTAAPNFGLNIAERYNINRKHTIAKVPRWDGDNLYCDIYTGYLPTNVDMKFEVKLFARNRIEVNEADLFIQQKFSIRQYPLSVKGRYMSLLLENTTDNSKLGSTEQDRYFSHSYNLNLQGQLIDEKSFEVANSVKVMTKTISINGQ